MKKMIVGLMFLAVCAVSGFAQSDLLTNTNYSNAGWSEAVPFSYPDEIAITVTNGMALQLEGGRNYVLNTAATCTNTIATVFKKAGLCHVRMNGAGSVLIADATTTVALGADVTLSQDDTLVLYFVSTTKVIKICTADN